MRLVNSNHYLILFCFFSSNSLLLIGETTFSPVFISNSLRAFPASSPPCLATFLFSVKPIGFNHTSKIV
jgi:hypothetical protein